MDKNTPDPFNPYHHLTEDIEDEVFAILTNNEVDYMVPESYYNNEDSNNLRRYAVQFIEELHERNKGERFDAVIPYTAITYFDRFSSGGGVGAMECSDKPVVGDTEIDLCLTCCLTIAWKLRTKTFSLQQFLVDKELTFTVESVLRMELQICKCLKWRIRALTPFTFVNYFLRFMLNLPPELPSKLRLAHQLILTSQCATAFTEYRPSVMAAAAVAVVVKMNFIPDMVLEFRNRASVLFFNTDLAMILECSEKLEPLYRVPPIPTAGEGPSSSTAEDKPPLGEIRLTLAEFNPDHFNPDELMNFELGWIEALKQLDGTRNIAQKLADCLSWVGLKV